MGFLTERGPSGPSPPVKDRVKGLIASLVCINAKCKCLWALKEKIKIPFLLMPVLSTSLFVKINLLSDISQNLKSENNPMQHLHEPAIRRGLFLLWSRLRWRRRRIRGWRSSCMRRRRKRTKKQNCLSIKLESYRKQEQWNAKLGNILDLKVQELKKLSNHLEKTAFETETMYKRAGLM